MKRMVPVYPWPMHKSVAAALAELDDIMVVEALPGGPGPVLAVMKAPPFVCDAIVVLEPDKLAQAVNIVAETGMKLVTVRDTISAISGNGELLHEWFEKRTGVGFK